MFWLLLAAGVLVAFVGVLQAPLHLKLVMLRDEKTVFHVGIEWLFLRLDREVEKGRPKPRPEPKRRKERRPWQPRWKAMRSALSASGLGAWVTRFLRRLAGAVRVRRLAADLRLGLEDPADTGRLFGLLAPFTLWVDRSRRCDVRLLPTFEGPALAGRAEAALSLYPARAAAGVLLFVFSPQAVRLVWVLVRSRW